MYHKTYPDFVAFLGQRNTPPGGFRTINEWIKRASIDSNSRLLDLACSTGYSGRTVHQLTRARVHGIDISEDAIARAQQIVDGDPTFSYTVADAARLPMPDSVFTHVLAGCNFGFIEERDHALSEVRRVLVPGGVLCVASFFYRRHPPEDLLDEVGDAIGYRPDVERDLEFWKHFFSQRFDPVSEQLRDIPPLGTRRVTRIVRKSVYGKIPALTGTSLSVRDACYHRLRETRLLLDLHRTYQGLMVSTWRTQA